MDNSSSNDLENNKPHGKKTTSNTRVVIAGASGLIGGHVLQQLLDEASIEGVYSLTRRAMPNIHSDKITQIVSNDLQVTRWNDDAPRPAIGIICLGTTKKKAGSKQALRKVDVELVCQVAQTMKMLGVERLAVVSSYGASIHSYSHYLNCKGHMEQNLMRFGFKQLVIARPGPLLGEREHARTDEKLLQTLSPFFTPLLMGPLQNLRPIDSKLVAQAMLYKLFENKYQTIDICSSTDMLRFLAKFR